MKICIIVIDCLRSDHLGCYGYEKHTSPNIDSIAAKSVVCESAYAQSNWTYPSIYTMLTGRYPTVLSVNWFDQRINNAFRVLPEQLGEIDFRSTLFTKFKVLLNGKGFCSHFDEVNEIGIDDDIMSAFSQWLERKGNAFLFFHIGEYVHEPFCAPKNLVDRFIEYDDDVGDPDTEIISNLTGQNVSGNFLRKSIAKINKGLQPLTKYEIDRLLAHYDAGICYVDGMIDKFYDQLHANTDDYIFILTADHGQAFMEHGFFGHGLSLYNEVIQVPLVVDFGGRYQGRIAEDIQLADLYPTILDALGMEIDEDIDGVSFWNGVGGDGIQDRTILAEGFPNVAIIENGQKLISTYSRHWSLRTLHQQFMRHNRTASWIRMVYSYLQRFKKSILFDLRQDPQEQNNLVRAQKNIYKELHNNLNTILLRLLNKSLPAADITLDKEIEKQLEKLGYL